MQNRAVCEVLLVQSIEETDRAGEALPLAERIEATRAALGNDPSLMGSEAEVPLSPATDGFLIRRADILLRSLRTRSPGVDHVLDVAGGATSLDRGMLMLAFITGAILSLVDGGGGINIFALPLAVLIVWNLVSYVRMLGPRLRHRSAAASAGSRSSGSGATAAATEALPGRSWFGHFYARWVRRRIERLLGHSTRFNAPLASGLRRFVADWWYIAQPLFQTRARRLLHLSAVSLALGLVAAYYLRAFVLRSAAGWEGGRVIGPETAHALLSMLYGPASLLSGIHIPTTEEIAKLRWSAPSLAGVGEPAIWVHLIAVTAGLYVVLPRLLAASWSTLSLWRLSRQFTLPPGVVGYVRTLFAAVR